jgi:hypothetical protein
LKALKQHSFFVGLDWHALERCELTPPINLSAGQGIALKAGIFPGSLAPPKSGVESYDDQVFPVV